MKDINLISYSVKGIKSLDEWAKLSFYKKSISNPIDFRNYNVKGIYGTNGVGKSAIVTSVRVLREIIINDGYLNDSLVQGKLNRLINRKLETLEYDVEYLVAIEKQIRLYHYCLTVGENLSGRYVIKDEQLSFRNATSHSNNYTVVFSIKNGEIDSVKADKEEFEVLREKTRNLLSNASLSALGIKRMISTDWTSKRFSLLEMEFIYHTLFGYSLFAYLDTEDEHTDYVIEEVFPNLKHIKDDELYKAILTDHNRFRNPAILEFSSKTIAVPEDQYIFFERQVDQLKQFLKIFKHDLIDITIDRRVNKEWFLCSLIMNYETYDVHAEFESTGIKKLIRLFPFLQKMVQGDIVFIDEMDSNLHDVYLCALLEYLMENGEGQLCFTTHNISPMDILRKNKKSIDFLSVDHTIYPWTTNGNYSPSRLYRNGMIEGSPFNVDSIDFLGVFEGDKKE